MIHSLFRQYAKYRDAQIKSLKQNKAQEQELMKLLRAAQNTPFGREHNFVNISSVEDYQKRVPIRSYEDFHDYWFDAGGNFKQSSTWHDFIPHFAVTSGTTSGGSKFIPISRQMKKSNERASLDMLVSHFIHNPHSRLFSGKSFVLGGSTELSQMKTVPSSPTAHYGDLSGIVAANLPWWARFFYFPTEASLLFISDYGEKIEKLTEAALKEKISSISGVPSWLLLLFDSLLKKTGKDSIADIFPDLELLIHGGVNFKPYREQFTKLITPSSRATNLTSPVFKECYPASEGFIAYQESEGLRLIVDNGIFIEFLEHDNPSNRYWIENVEIGKSYIVALTTNAGLWSYNIGDVVKVLSKDPLILEVSGRTKGFLSAFGEHLLASEIENAVAKALKSFKSSLHEFTVGPIFPQNTSELGYHQYYIEIACPDSLSSDSLAKNIDQILCETNDDYRAHREGDFGMAEPCVTIVPPGTFHNYMKSIGKFGGQHKVPRVVPDEDKFQKIREFMRGIS